MRKLYKDTPKELVSVMNAINFLEISVQDQDKLFQDLSNFVEKELVKKGHITHRKKPSAWGDFGIRKSVPDRALDFLNQYDYGNPGMIKSKMLKSQAMDYLISIGIPLHATNSKPAMAEA
jgi:hypothetical protein